MNNISNAQLSILITTEALESVTRYSVLLIAN